jgi:hypothetical protein
MIVITGERGTGKTHRLIEEAAKSGAYIVVKSRDLASWTAEQARGMGKQIPFPITFDELLTGRASYGRGMRYHILIDDVDLLLHALCLDIPIDGIAISTEADHYEHLHRPEGGVPTGDTP